MKNSTIVVTQQVFNNETDTYDLRTKGYAANSMDVTAQGTLVLRSEAGIVALINNWSSAVVKQ